MPDTVVASPWQSVIPSIGPPEASGLVMGMSAIAHAALEEPVCPSNGGKDREQSKRKQDCMETEHHF